MIRAASALGPRARASLLTALVAAASTACIGPWYGLYGIQSDEELKQPSAAAKLAKAIDPPDMFTCTAAVQVEALGPDGRDALPALERALGRCWGWRDRREPYGSVAKALVAVAGPERAQALFVEALASSEHARRAEAGVGLLTLGPAAASAVPALTVALGDPEWEGRYVAARALEHLGPAAASSAPALATLLEDQADWHVRAQAADALGAIGVATPEVIAALERRTAPPEDDGDVVAAATNALRRLRIALANGTVVPSATKPAALAAEVAKEPAPRPTSKRVVVAVFDVEDSASRFDAKILGQLTDYLAVKLSEVMSYRVIPREQLRARLRQAKVDSYERCVDESCQIELGKALAAERTLSTKLLQVGQVCAMTSILLDLRTETAERAASVKTSCDDNGLINGLDQLVTQLAAARGDP